MLPAILNPPRVVSHNIAFPFITIALQMDLSIQKEKLEQKINLVIERVAGELGWLDSASKYMVHPAVDKVRSIFNNLERSLNKKSVIVFLAPFIEKIHYLNF